MRKTTLLLALLLVAATQARAEQTTIRLRVSATIPPRPCEYPQRCAPPKSESPTSATVSADSVLYVGAPPEVLAKGDQLIVRF